MTIYSIISYSWNYRKVVVMQGRCHHQPELFATINLSDMIPANHLLRKIDRAIDLGFIYDLTSDLYCSDNGRRSIDPVLFFRMQIIGYLYDIPSDRQLCEEVHLNLAYRWFCQLNLGDKVPDHSSLTRIRDRFGEVTYLAIFERFIRQWQETGLIKGKRLVADASLIAADASFDSLVERDDADPEARPLKYYEKRYADFREGKRTRKVSNQTHVSGSDPDATLVSRPGTWRKLSYKVHYSADADSRIITDCHATTGARHESIVLPDRIDYQRDKLDLPIQEVIADRGYGRGPTYSHCRERGIRTYIPLHDNNAGKGRLSKGDFFYDRRNDRYRCPQKHYLYPYEKLEHGMIKRYRVTGGHCRQCPLKKSCLPSSQLGRARFVYRSPHQDEIDRVRVRQKTQAFKKKLVERHWKIEGLFAEAKNNHGLGRARYRGLAKMQIQCLMVALIQNFKRALAFFCLAILGILQWLCPQKDKKVCIHNEIAYI